MPRKVGRRLGRGHEVALLRALDPMVRQIRETVRGVRTVQDARRVASALKREWSDRRIDEIVRGVGVRIEAAGSAPWRGLASAVERAESRGTLVARNDAKPYDGASLLAQWSKEAARLIKSVRDEVAEGLRADIERAATAGEDPSSLARKWRRQGIPVKFGTLEGRTKVIAQHQVSNLNALIQRERARSVGVSEFIWHHSGKPPGRRREHHHARDGRSYSYDKPPSDGLPGTQPNCECWAESIIPDALVRSLGLGRIIEG